MSTHVLDTVEKYCDRFVLLNSGHVTFKGSLQAMRAANNDQSASLNDIYLSMAKGDRHE